MSDLWQEFQDEFLVKLNSADFHKLLDNKMAQPLTKGSNSVVVSRASSIAAAKSSLLQQRFDALSATLMIPLQLNVAKPAPPPPKKSSPRRPDPPSNTDSAASGFFLTETVDQGSPATDPATHPASDLAPPSPYGSHNHKLSSFLPPPGRTSPLSSAVSPSSLLPPPKSLLQCSVETAIRSVSWEKYKPLPPQHAVLQSLLDRLTSSKDEQDAFLADVAASVRARRRSAGGGTGGGCLDVVSANVKAAKDGTFGPGERRQRIEDMAELREVRHHDAHERVDFIKVEAERAKVEGAMRKTEAKERVPREEMWQKWLSMLQQARFFANLKVEFKKKQDLQYVVENKKTLASKIVNMWKIKKAPDQGQKYRKAVTKLRGFIANKTTQWKTNQKNRAVDTMKDFLKDHKRANLPIVVANFVRGVKTWQRWWRVYETATANRIKALLIIWEDVEAEYVAEREAALYADAELKKKLEADFDLDRLVSKGKAVPHYAQSHSSKSSAPAPSSAAALPAPPAGGGSVTFGKSPNVANRSLKQLASSHGPGRAGDSHSKVSPATLKRQLKMGGGGKLNKAQTSLIIDLRLQKDLQALKERKPTWHLKRDMLKRKLSLLRSIYKSEAPGYIELLSQDGPASQKINTIRDVKLLLEGKLTEENAVEVVETGKRKKRKFPSQAKCIKVFSMISRDTMKSWIHEAYMEQEAMITARNQVLIDAMNPGVNTAGAKGGMVPEKPPGAAAAAAAAAANVVM